MVKPSLDRVMRDVARLALTADSLVELCRGVRDALDPLVPSDRWCGFAVDPATLLPTSGYHDEGVDVAVVHRLFELEFGEDDVNHIPLLARSAAVAATLSEATAGDPARSARWRDVLVPSGLHHEVRVVLRSGGAVWGAFVLLRGGDVADFDRRDVAALARLAPVIGDGLRATAIRRHLQWDDDGRHGGMVVLDGRTLTVRSASDTATAWLDRFDDGGCVGGLPTAAVSAARTARATGTPTTVRVRTRTGRWVTITAERLGAGEAPGGEDVGLVIQPSRPAEIAQILAAAYGLTPREQDVVLLVAAGATNDEIARRLGLSRHTVADHLKKVFGKVDVVTRGELTSKLFFDHYLPRAVAGSEVGADGWFLPGDSRMP